MPERYTHHQQVNRSLLEMASSTEILSSLRQQENGLTDRASKLACMQGGSGDDSYAQNSHVQNYSFHAYGKPHLAEAIHQCALFDRPQPGTFRIADFGCSHGRNTLEHAEFIVERIKERRKLAPQIQYFFSDLPANDFNSLFRLLKPFNKEAGDQELQNFYAAGVPGSFYTRLFPEASLDFAISLFSLHWLSQVPLAVLDKTSPAWNGGHIWIHGKRPKVAEAYAQQFQSDMKSFLKCRAQELAKGAVLFFYAVSRAEEHPTGQYYSRSDEDPWSGSFESIWDEMVSAGLVDADEKDMFNVPHYNFHRAELEEALKDVPELEIIKIELIEDKLHLPKEELQMILNDPHRFADLWAGFMRSLMKPLVQKHIGEERAAEFFDRLHRIETVKGSQVQKFKFDVLVAVLRRQ